MAMKDWKQLKNLKVTYFKRFVQKTTLNVKNLVSIIRNREADVRCCYSHTSGLSSDDYVKMIPLDASFIIMVFLEKCDVEEWMCHDNHTTFSKWLMIPVLSDLSLLENQLPFFIIEELYNLAFASHSNYCSFTQLTCEIFEHSAAIFFSLQKEPPVSPYPDFKIMHFVDLFRIISLPQSQRLQKKKSWQKSSTFVQCDTVG
jgi:hypothetical protein